MTEQLDRVALAALFVLCCWSPLARATDQEQKAYDASGHKGPWSAKVSGALKSYKSWDSVAMEPLASAWKEGCRDPVVARVLLKAYRRRQLPAEANAIWQQLVSEDKTAYPGGLYRYGLCPYELALLSLELGERKAAADQTDASYGEALAAGAKEGAAMVRHAQLYIKLSQSIDEALGFWKEHAEELRSVQGHLGFATMEVMARRLEGKGDPREVLKFLKDEPDSPTKRALTSHYDRQAELAARSREANDPLPYPVLVGFRDRVLSLDVVASFTRWIALPPVPSPFRVECEARDVQWSHEDSGGYPMAALGVWIPGMGADPLCAELGAQGEFRSGLLQMEHDHLRRPIEFLTTDQWHKLRVEHRQGAFRTFLDDTPYRAFFLEDPVNLTVFPRLMVRSAKGEFREVRVYTFSSVKVDNAAIEKLLKEFDQAQADGNLSALQAANQALQKHWSAAPEAAPAAKLTKSIVEAYEGILSKEGLSLCTQGFVDRALFSHGSWELRGKVLAAKPCPDCHQCYLTHFLPMQDVEVSGTMKAGDSWEGSFLWLSWKGNHPNCPATFAFRPGFQEVVLGGYWNTQTSKKRLDPPRDAVSFCVRARDDKTVLFINDGAVPVLRAGRIQDDGFLLTIGGWEFPKDAPLEFEDLRIRHFARDRRLDAPAEMPKSVSAPATGPVREPEWP